MSETKKGEKDSSKTIPAPSWLIWIVRGVSFMTLALILGYLAFLVMRDSVPPQFDVDMDFSALDQRNAQWVLPVDVTNMSTRAVTDATVSVDMVIGEETITRTSTITILGEGETAKIEVVYQDRPTPENMRASVTIYQNP